MIGSLICSEQTRTLQVSVVRSFVEIVSSLQLARSSVSKVVHESSVLECSVGLPVAVEGEVEEEVVLIYFA